MDDETGFQVIPKRYLTASGREKIDLIRDSMSDHEFAMYCRGNALKYTGRNKGPKDGDKALWYRQMADHVLNGAPDPRHRRPGFTPYERASLPEQLTGRRIDVLNAGYVRLVEDWGHGDARMSEAGIIEAARQSTQGAFRGWRRDAKLLRYLHEHKHSTPFEFAGMVLEVKAPMFVFRQWHRHRTQSYNEMSARYIPLPREDYIPTVDRVVEGSQSTANKQAAGSKIIDAPTAGRFLFDLQAAYDKQQERYETALAFGVPKELARLHLTVGRYSQMRASALLRNWLAFLTLRMDPHAQWEIRQYANAVHDLLLECFPQTVALFDEGRR